MRDYELVVLLHPDLELNLDGPLKKVTKIITDNGGKVVNQDIWGKRKLAYPINKENFAIYVYFDIQLEPEAVTKAEGLFNIANEVIRYLITTPVPVEEETKDDKSAEESDNKAEKKTVEKEKAEPTVTEDEKPKVTKPTKEKEEK